MLMDPGAGGKLFSTVWTAKTFRRLALTKMDRRRRLGDDSQLPLQQHALLFLLQTARIPIHVIEAWSGFADGSERKQIERQRYEQQLARVFGSQLTGLR